MKYGISPAQVLEAAGAGVPVFAFNEVGKLLVETMKDTSDPRQLLLAKQLVAAKLANAGRKNGVDYDKRWLLNFPIYFLDDWNIELPSDRFLLAELPRGRSPEMEAGFCWLSLAAGCRFCG